MYSSISKNFSIILIFPIWRSATWYPMIKVKVIRHHRHMFPRVLGTFLEVLTKQSVESIPIQIQQRWKLGIIQLSNIILQLAFSTINGHSSMLNQLLLLRNQTDIVNDPFITRIMTG
ncbi:hypothetical protein ACTFIR_003905 [Dictyostelium discoideum]